MRVAVMGSGGLGGYFGALLQQGGKADVHFIARGKHLEAMRADGLRIDGPQPLHVKQVNVTANPADVGVVDVVWLCVKLWDAQQAIEQIRPMVGPQTALISFQNGVLKDTYLREAFPANPVMGGVGYVATTIGSPGVIKQTGTMQRLVFGEFDGSQSARGKALLEACVAGGVNAELSTNIQREIWQKYVFLVGISGCTSAMRTTVGPIRSHPQARAFLHDVMREVVAVALAQGIDIAPDFADTAMQRVDTVAPDMTSSMAHDLQRGNPLEVRWLAGGVAELGQAKGVPTPLNRSIADILALHAQGVRNA